MSKENFIPPSFYKYNIINSSGHIDTIKSFQFVYKNGNDIVIIGDVDSFGNIKTYDKQNSNNNLIKSLKNGNKKFLKTITPKLGLDTFDVELHMDYNNLNVDVSFKFIFNKSLPCFTNNMLHQLLNYSEFKTYSNLMETSLIIS